MGKPPSSDKNGLKKGPWTAEEDEKLLDYIQKHGHGRWRILPKNAGLKRCGKSCRLRWTNYLRPDIKRGKFSLEEEEAIVQLHSVLGNKWSAIATRLPGRTDNEIKNYWNTHVKKKLLRMGIDPVTHKPRLDLLHLYSLINSSLLGIGPLVGQNHPNPSTSFFPCQAQDQSPQFFQENNPPNQILNDTHLMNIANLDQLLPSNNDLSNFGLQSCSWDGNNNGNMGENSLVVPSLSYHGNDQSSTVSPSFENLPSLMSFNTIFSTPSSYSSTPLHSSPTTYVNGGTEDETDGYYQINSLNSNIM